MSKIETQEKLHETLRPQDYEERLKASAELDHNVVVTAGAGSGFYEPKPLAPNPETFLIDGMANAMAPHGPANPARKGKQELEAEGDAK